MLPTACALLLRVPRVGEFALRVGVIPSYVVRWHHCRIYCGNSKVAVTRAPSVCVRHGVYLARLHADVERVRYSPLRLCG